MSKIRVISNPMQRGRNGANTYYVTKGTQIVRPSRNNSNYGEGASRTPAQQARRILWSNPVNFYKVSSYWMQKAFENTDGLQSDYNMFMSLNIDNSLVAFTKGEAKSSACIAEAFKVSQGSLPSVSHVKGDTHIISSISASSAAIIQQPVASACADILEENPGLDKNYQISLIVYQQSVDSSNIPHLYCYAYELSLNDTRTDVTLADVFPSSLIDVQSGSLAIKLSGYTGGACFVLSRTDSASRIRVSSQELVTNNDYLIALYSSEIQYTKAAESYGIDPGVFLQKGIYKGAGSVPSTVEMWGAMWYGAIVLPVGDPAPSVDLVNQFEYIELFKLAPIPPGTYSATIYFMQAAPSLDTIKTTVIGQMSASSGGSVFRIDTPITPEVASYDQIVRIDVQVGGMIYRGIWLQQ